MTRKVSLSDIRREQFESVRPLLEKYAQKRINPRTIDRYEVFNWFFTKERLPQAPIALLIFPVEQGFKKRRILISHRRAEGDTRL